MRDTDYAYAVAAVRSRENGLLTRQETESMLTSPDSDACLSRLASKGWGEHGTSMTEGKLIDSRSARLWSFIGEIVPDPAVFDFFRIPNDYHNLKAAIKAFIMSQDAERLFIEPCTVDTKLIREAVKERDYSLLPEKMRGCAEDAFRMLLEQRNGQLCDIVLDRASLEASYASAKEYGGLLLEIAKLYVLKANIKTAWRCAAQKRPQSFIKRALAVTDCAPDAEALTAAALSGCDAIIELLKSVDPELGQALSGGDIEEFGKACDIRRSRLCDSAKYTPLGSDPIVAYIVATENEIRNVRLILTGKRNGISDERISEKLIF